MNWRQRQILQRFVIIRLENRYHPVCLPKRLRSERTKQKFVSCFYGCQTRSSSLKTEHKVQVFKKVLKTCFYLRRMKQARKVLICTALNRVVKPRTLWWTGHVARMGKRGIRTESWSVNLFGNVHLGYRQRGRRITLRILGRSVVLMWGGLNWTSIVLNDGLPY